jgi:hypothetical protein
MLSDRFGARLTCRIPSFPGGGRHRCACTEQRRRARRVRFVETKSIRKCVSINALQLLAGCPVSVLLSVRASRKDGAHLREGQIQRHRRHILM